MPGVTADTNIYISGILYGGLPRRFLDLARLGVFRLDISEAILNEMLRVLREKFEYSSAALGDLEQRIRGIARLVSPTQTLDVIAADPLDNRILECAVAAKSDFIAFARDARRHRMAWDWPGAAAEARAPKASRR